MFCKCNSKQCVTFCRDQRAAHVSRIAISSSSSFIIPCENMWCVRFIMSRAMDFNVFPSMGMSRPGAAVAMILLAK
jgi:hypothetical protein